MAPTIACPLSPAVNGGYCAKSLFPASHPDSWGSACLLSTLSKRIVATLALGDRLCLLRTFLQNHKCILSRFEVVFAFLFSNLRACEVASGSLNVSQRMLCFCEKSISLQTSREGTDSTILCPFNTVSQTWSRESVGKTAAPWAPMAEGGRWTGRRVAQKGVQGTVGSQRRCAQAALNPRAHHQTFLCLSLLIYKIRIRRVLPLWVVYRLLKECAGRA